MEAKPLISVIIPVYKVEQYLPVCLDSMLEQTYRNFELILVNDGSPDNSWQIMQEYAEKDARVRIFRKENGGVSSARNFGLEQAKGSYIGFVDSDDAVLPQYLEWLYEALCTCGTRISMCRYRSVREGEPLWSLTECPTPKKITLKTYSWMEDWSGGHCWRMLTHRDVLQDVRFDSSLFYGEDALFFVTEFIKAGSLAFLDCPLYAYFERQNSAVRQDANLKFYTAMLAWEAVWQMVRELPDPFRSTTEERCIMSCAEVYFRLSNQPERDTAKEKTLLCKAKEHRRAAWKIPSDQKSQKLQALMMGYCPHFGAKVWKLVRWVKGLKN